MKLALESNINIDIPIDFRILNTSAATGGGRGGRGVVVPMNSSYNKTENYFILYI